MGIKIKENKILVVEGKEEEMFFSALGDHLNLRGIQILPIGGKTKLRDNLKLIKVPANFASVVSLGIVRDADDDAERAFQSVQDALREAGLPFPSQMMRPTDTNPQVTVMILPDGIKPGMLEDLCLASIATDPVTSCIDQYFQCVESQAGYLPKDMSKAKIHAFLASRPDPDKRLGEAAQSGYFPWDHQALNQIKDFLRIL